MFVTVTFNPSIDYIVTTDKFIPGKTNRACAEKIFPGGKGLNVSMVLENMGIDSTALGFTAGFTGDEIVRLLNEKKIHTDFIRLPRGYNRINVKIRSDEESELNGIGPDIGKDELATLMDKTGALGTGDFLVLAGSVPASAGMAVYADICRKKQGSGLKIVVDATGKLLRDTLQYGPFLVKPNIAELEELFGVKITSHDETISYARKLQSMGASNVLVSMAGDGAVLMAENGRVYECSAPKGTVINSVGAGDSMVAGFLAGYENLGISAKLCSGIDDRYERALKLGICAGSASAFSEDLADGQKIQEIFELI